MKYLFCILLALIVLLLTIGIRAAEFKEYKILKYIKKAMKILIVLEVLILALHVYLR